MKAEDISEAMNSISDEFIESANERRKPKTKKSGESSAFSGSVWVFIPLCRR